jgi:hypothetical protein
MPSVSDVGEPVARRGGVPAPVPENLSYRIKRRLLGRPLTTASLHNERLSRPLALGVLSPDCISSSAYGTEEMLIELLPKLGCCPSPWCCQSPA